MPGLGEVGHSPRGTSRSAETLDWGPMWSGSQFIFHPNAPTPPTGTLMPPWCPYIPTSPLYFLMPPIPTDAPTSPWTTQPLHSLPVPSTPLTPLLAPTLPDAPDTPPSPYTPMPLHLCLPLSPYAPYQAPNASLTPLHPWWLPDAPIPYQPPISCWCLYTFGGPSALTLLASPQCIPNIPYTLWWSCDIPWCPYTPCQVLMPPDVHYTSPGAQPLHSLPAPWHPLHPC